MSGRRGEKTPPLKRTGFFLLAAGVALGDQLTKAVAQHFLSQGPSRPVIPQIFHLTLVENTGIAFGLFQNGEEVLLGVILVSVVLLVFFGFRTESSRVSPPWAVALILGGAVGNLIDRIRGGAVIDFLDFRIWPVFNFADIAISAGVALFLLDCLKKPSRVS